LDYVKFREKTRNGEPVMTVKIKREHKARKAITFKELAERYLEFTKRLKSHDRLKSFVNTLTKRFNGKPINDFIRDVVNILDKKIHTLFIPGENAKNGNS
jgi:hypothetical protein